MTEPVDLRALPGRELRQPLLVRGTRLTTRGDTGYVVVFDDITHLAQAQRDAAWGEVARRLAMSEAVTVVALERNELKNDLNLVVVKKQLEEAAIKE